MKLYLYDAEDNLVYEGTKAACRNFVLKNPGEYETKFKRKEVREKAVVEEVNEKITYAWQKPSEE